MFRTEHILEFGHFVGSLVGSGAVPKVRVRFVSTSAQSLVINEVVAANWNGIPDEDGDRPDWIELYNGSGTSLNVAGYGLSDDKDLPFKWRLPSWTMPSGGYLVIYASGKDRANVPYRIHSNFSIRSTGERLAAERQKQFPINKVEEFLSKPPPASASICVHPRSNVPPLSSGLKCGAIQEAASWNISPPNTSIAQTT